MTFKMEDEGDYCKHKEDSIFLTFNTDGSQTEWIQQHQGAVLYVFQFLFIAKPMFEKEIIQPSVSINQTRWRWTLNQTHLKLKSNSHRMGKLVIEVSVNGIVSYIWDISFSSIWTHCILIYVHNIVTAWTSRYKKFRFFPEQIYFETKIWILTRNPDCVLSENWNWH